MNLLSIRIIAGLVTLALASHAVASDAEARKIIETSGVTGGLIVHVGSGDGNLTAALGAGEGFVVQGLDTDRESIRKAREKIAAEKRYGKVSASVYDGKHLPYVDDLVRDISSD